MHNSLSLEYLTGSCVSFFLFFPSLSIGWKLNWQNTGFVQTFLSNESLFYFSSCNFYLFIFNRQGKRVIASNMLVNFFFLFCLPRLELFVGGKVKSVHKGRYVREGL